MILLLKTNLLFILFSTFYGTFLFFRIKKCFPIDLLKELIKVENFSMYNTPLTRKLMAVLITDYVLFILNTKMNRT